MRVLQVISHYVPAYRFGGPLRVAHGLARALVGAGHSVTVCCTNLADENRNLDLPIDSPVEVDGATVYYEPTVLSRYWGYSPSLGRRLKQEVAKADVALVHSHYQYAGFVGARLARRHQKPYVIFPHNSLREYGIAFKSSFQKRLYLGFLERANLRNAMFLAFNSPEEKDGSFHSDRGLVVPNGISPADFLDRPPLGWFRRKHRELDQKVFLLFLGRLDFKQKGLDILIPALARVHEDQPDLHLVVAGPDQSGGKERVMQCAEEHGIVQAVTCTGLLDGADRIGALQDADAFVLPSRFEGSSIALLEALHFGLPLVATDRVGIATEIQRSGAGVVVPASEDGVTHGLEALADSEYRNSIRGNGTDLIREKYTWDAIADRLVRTIQVYASRGRSDPARR